jgi:hypothetical protein
MARYFFDVDDGFSHTIDDEGLECETLEAAKSAAVEALPEIAINVLPAGDSHHVAVRVQAEDGTAILTAVLSLAVTTWVSNLPV